MYFLNVLVNYNPIALLTEKILEKLTPIQDLINYYKQIIFNNLSPQLTKFLFTIGIFSITYNVCKTIYQAYKKWNWLYYHFKNRNNFSKELMEKKYGKCWVAITGFTQGIGWGFAKQFAKLGFNLVLIGRNKQKIDKCTKYLNKYHPDTQYKIVQADASVSTDFQKIKDQIKKLYQQIDIGIIINNIAMVAGGSYLQIDKEGLLKSIKVNARFQIDMTQLFLPFLRNRRSRSAILNISSCTGVFFGPYIGAYSSTKRFLDIYTRSIALENNDKIDVLSARPFGVTTKMMLMKKGPLMISPQQCAKSIIYDLGKTNITYGGFKHKLSAAFTETLSQEEVFKLYQFFRQKK